MSGEPKTLTPQAMTLEEALMHLADHPTQVESGELGWHEPWALRYEPEQRAWAALTEYGDYVLLKEWPALITEITDVPVVARDEAAEPKSIGWDDVTEEHVVGAFLDAQAEAHRYRNALEALLNSVHRGIYDAAWALEAVANAEALISPGLDDDYRKAKAQEAYERRRAGGENEK